MPYRYKYERRKHPARGRMRIAAATLFVLVLLVISSFAILQYFSTDGFVEANIIQVSGDSIIIGSNCAAIVAATSPERALSIQEGLSGTTGERPNTHDTFAQALESFNITLEAVKFNNYDGKYYYSDIVLRSGSKVLALDAMPSDAIALALRMNATVYINRTLLAQIGKRVC